MNRGIVIKSLSFVLALSLLVPGGLPAPQSQQAAPPKSGKPALTPQQLDELTAPIALYPDALLAQMLTCAQSYFQVKALNDFLKKNSQLKGSAVQDAVEKEGFEASYIALSTFPQVVQMMAEKADWTKKLGQAFTSDQQGIFDSIQRLRAQAQKQGNLKTTEQQEVVSQKTQSGTEVIVIQPANPQVVYVPQYTTVVYTQPAPPPQPSGASVAGAALIGFTAGIIIGAAANNHYWGPYGWHGGYMHHDAWNDYYEYREDAREDWMDHRENMNENRQQNYDQRQANRQTNQDSRQANQDTRQTDRQTNQDTRQTDRQTSQDSRQTSRQQGTAGSQASRQGTQAAGQSARQTSASQGRATSSSSRGYGAQSAQTSGTRSSAFSGYGGASAEKSASARGSSSRGSSRSSSRGGGRSR